MQAAYKFFLYVVVVLVVGFIGYNVEKIRTRTPLPPQAWLYIVSFLVLFLALVYYELRFLAEKEAQREVKTSKEPDVGSPGPAALSPEGDRKDAEARNEIAARFLFPLSSLPEAGTPDDEALARGQEYLQQGKDLETICRWVNPQYPQWNSFQRLIYKSYLKAALDLRRAKGGDSRT